MTSTMPEQSNWYKKIF